MTLDEKLERQVLAINLMVEKGGVSSEDILTLKGYYLDLQEELLNRRVGFFSRRKIKKCLKLLEEIFEIEGVK